MANSPMRIAIIGGGPAGLCLAKILHQKQQEQQEERFHITVYEADASRTARKTQGGSLDLHSATGQRALKLAGVFSEFQKHIQPGGDALTIRTHQNETLYQDSGGYERPEIERRDLRMILLNSLEDTNVQIQWGYKLVRVEENIITERTDSTSRQGRVRLMFANDQALVCDMVVGADGAWSKVRPVLTDATPEYTGVSFWDMEGPRTEALNKAFPGNGMTFALDEKGTVLIAHINQKAVHTYVGSYVPKGQLKPMTDLLTNWDDRVSLLATSIQEENNNSSQSPTVTLREICALPIGLQWKRPTSRNDQGQEHWSHHVAIIGDAAHVMSPMAGEGVNLALADAADLAHVLWHSPQSAASVLEQRYMFRRTQRAAQESHRNLHLFFQTDSQQQRLGAQVVATKMKEIMSWLDYEPCSRLDSKYSDAVKVSLYIRLRLAETVREKRNEIQAAGRLDLSDSEIVIALFRAYETSTNEEFIKSAWYWKAERQSQVWTTADALMHKADAKYVELHNLGTWGKLSAKDEQIIALQATIYKQQAGKPYRSNSNTNCNPIDKYSKKNSSGGSWKKDRLRVTRPTNWCTGPGHNNTPMWTLHRPARIAAPATATLKPSAETTLELALIELL
eukprot:scaffold4805_cov136-Cylindrotheca_fusiformis.AAC.21